MARLQHKAWWVANIRNKTNTDVVIFCIFCIQADSRWISVLEQLMPKNNPIWQSIRKVDQYSATTHVIFGAVDYEFCDYLAEEFPDTADNVLVKPGDGVYKGIVLNDWGCTVIDVLPQQDHSQLA
jgi:hypothetical protein